MKNKTIPLLGFFTLAPLFLFAQGGNNRYTFTGKVKGISKGLVCLQYRTPGGKNVNDSCQLQNGVFSFQNDIAEPTWAHLQVISDDGNKPDVHETDLFLSKGSFSAAVDYNKSKVIKISGPKPETEYALLQRETNPILEADRQIENDYVKTKHLYLTAQKRNDAHETDSLAGRLDTIDLQLEPSNEKLSEISRMFVATHPSSCVSAFVLSMFKARWPLDTVRRLYSNLGKTARNSRYGKEVKTMMGSIENNSKDKTAWNFSATDLRGNKLTLSDFKGKYVLLDFWASWCGPCRKGNPHLIQLYKKYHKQGLAVIGISADMDPTAWKKAVKADSIDIWYNILSGENKKKKGSQDFSDAIDTHYGVAVLPTKFLIDKNGMIIGRYDGTATEPLLDKKLNDLFR